MTQYMAIPSYIYPDYSNPSGYWNQMEAASGPVQIVMINPDSGPGSSSNSDYVTQTAGAQGAGLTVIGYVHTEYTGVSLPSIESQIDDYYNWYAVDGIFVDECTTAAGSDQTYYQDIYNYVQGKGGPAVVMINPGVPPDSSYMTACTICCTCETDLGTYRVRGIQPLESSYPADRFCHIVYAAAWNGDGTRQLYEALSLSRSYNAGYVFVTNAYEPNPYDVLPTGNYWAQFITQLRGAGQFSAAWPALEDGFDQYSGYMNSQWTAAGSVSISGYELVITGHSTYADYLESAAALDFTGRAASVEAVTMPTAASGEAFLRILKDGNNLIAIGKSGSSLVCRSTVSGTASDVLVTWNATSMAYWRVTLAAGAVTWQTSPDGSAWTTQRTLATGLPALTTAYLQLLVGHYNAGDPDQAATFDNVLATGPAYYAGIAAPIAAPLSMYGAPNAA